MSDQITAEKYRELFKLRAQGKLESMECTKSLINRIKKIWRPGMHVLDVGCGVGHYFAELKKLEGIIYMGIDADSKMIDIAHEVWKDEKAVFTVGKADALLQVADNSFDIVICYNVILHLPDYKDVLEELVRVSRHYVFVRSLFGDKTEIKNVEVPKGYGELYKQLFYNSYSESEVRKFLFSLNNKLFVDIENDVVKISDESIKEQEKVLHVSQSEFTTSKQRRENWKNLDLQYKVLKIEKIPKILAIIPARKGSRRLPNKNVLMLGNRPLWRWTYDEAVKSKYINGNVIVSTNDEMILVDLSTQYRDKRPESLCDSETSTEDVVNWVINQEELKGTKYDYVIVLQPTSPLRTGEDIDTLIEKALRENAESMVSAYKTSKPVCVDGKWFVDNVMFIHNGAMYFISVPFFKSGVRLTNEYTKIYEMPAEKSVDIDCLWEFKIAEMLIENKDVKE